MPRLFVAIDLPDNIKDALVALQVHGISGARPVKRPQMHLTLRFIGEVDSAQFRAIRENLGPIQTQSFEMRLQGVGQFPSKGNARVLWMGISAPPLLRALHQQLESRLSGIGFAPDPKGFSPHITLARFNNPPPRQPLSDFMKRQESFQTQSFPVTECILFSSVLSSSGPTYTSEQIYSLQNGIMG